MKKVFISSIGEFVATLSILLVLACMPAKGAELANTLVSEAPGLRQDVAQRAVQAMKCATRHSQKPEMLIVVDMSLPSSRERMFAFSLDKKAELITKATVAHGKGSDPDGRGIPSKFGNDQNSGMTSLGLYKVAESYEGKHGLARRLDGLMEGWNDNARSRAVVLHSSKYVNDGYAGRSLGCPATSEETLALLEQHNLANALLWVDGQDPMLAKAVESCNAKRYVPMHEKPKAKAEAKANVMEKAAIEEDMPLEWQEQRMCLPDFAWVESSYEQNTLAQSSFFA